MGRHRFSSINKFLIIFCIIAACLILLFSVFLWVKEKNSPKVQVTPNNCYDKTITVVADYDYDPYSFIDNNGKMAGHDVELIYYIANEMKVNVKLKLLPWNQAMKEIEEGRADIILGLEYANEEANTYELTTPFNSDQFVCFGKKKFQYITELKGKRIATLDENKNYDYIFKYAKNIHCESYSEAFDQLQKNKVDYVICRYAVGRRIIANKSYNNVDMTGPTLINNQLCMGVRKDEKKLCNQINEAIDTLMENGCMEELSQEWLGEYIRILTINDFLIKYKAVFILGGALILLIIIILLICIYMKTKKAKEKAELNEKCIEILSRQTGNAIFEWDNVGKEMSMMTNYSKYKELYKSAIAVDLDKSNIYADDIEKFNNIRNLSVEGMEINNERFRIVEKDESISWYEVTTRSIKNSDDTVIRVVGILNNINDRVRKEEQLKKDAEVDLATGVYNKLTVEKIIDEYLTNIGVRGCSMFVIDIDNLKTINDTYGHKYGDIVIMRLANELKQNFRYNDIIGRIGGDEFIAFIEESSYEVIEKKARDMCFSYRSEIITEDGSFEISASVGVAIRENETNFLELFQRADEALYQTKKSGKDSYYISTS